MKKLMILLVCFFTLQLFALRSMILAEIILFDNFESYEVGQYPSGYWYNLYSGVKADISSVHTYCNSPNAFHMEGSSNWSRIDGINLSYDNQITYQVCVYVPDVQRGASVGFFESQGNMAPSYNALIFSNDGKVCIHDSGQPDMELQSFNPALWYIVTVSINFNRNMMDVYIDGDKKYSGVPRSTKDNCQIFALETNGVIKPTLAPAAVKYLSGFDWPGNIRQMRNFVERLMIMKQGDLIDLKEVVPLLDAKEPATIPSDSEPKPLQEAREKFEREYILRILEENNWKIAKTAEVLNMDRANLYRKMKQLGISIEQ